MTDFQIHDITSAPEGAKPLLEGSQKAYGMIPNLHGVFAESPQILEAYQQVGTLFSNSSLSPVERHIVWISINVYHSCHYCVPAHTMIAKGDNVSDEILDNLRNNRPLADAKQEALRQFTLKVTEQRGVVSDADVQAFLEAGYTKANILDVVLGLSHKVMSNYVNHLANTPVDAPFQKFAWTPPAHVQAAE